MPFQSKAQARFMYAHQDDKDNLGAVAREFISASPKGKGAEKKLPERKGKKRKPFGSLSPQ